MYGAYAKDGGGLIYFNVLNDVTLTFEQESSMVYSCSGGNGGGIYINVPNANLYLTISDTTISNSNAASNGGFVYVGD